MKPLLLLPPLNGTNAFLKSNRKMYKKNINIKSSTIMNKKQVTPFFLFLLATLLSLGTASAQSVVTTSSRDRIQGVGSVKQLAASDNGDITVTYSWPVSGSGMHDFVVRNMRTGTSRKIRFSNPSTGTYALNEIKVDNGTCYFIGQYTITTLGPSMGNPQSPSYALFGYFSIDDVFSGSATIYTKYITWVGNLSRMTVYDHGSHIFAVGSPQNAVLDNDGHPMGSCLVDIESPTSTPGSWNISVVSSSTNETMTDVASTPDGIIVVSKFHNDNYTIGLRYMKDGSVISSGNFVQFQKLYTFNTQHMMLNATQENVTYRNASDPILIDSLTIAHVCSGTNVDKRGVCLYRIDIESFKSTDTMKLSDAQYMHLGSGLELKDLANYYYGDLYHQGHEYAAVLVNSPNANQSIVGRAIWAVPGVYTQRALIYSNNTMKIGSLACYQRGKYIFMAGQRPNGTYLMHALQHSAYMSVNDILCSLSGPGKRNFPMGVVLPSIDDINSITKVNYIQLFALPDITTTATNVTTYNECSYSDYERLN